MIKNRAVAATQVKHANDAQDSEQDAFQCAVCGVSECCGDPQDCEANLRPLDPSCMIGRWMTT